MKVVVFTTSSRLQPASAKITDRFLSACSICATTPAGHVPLAKSLPAVPATNTRLPTTIAWL